MVYEDPYTVLGLRKGADKRDVQQAFRDLALKYHPDRQDRACLLSLFGSRYSVEKAIVASRCSSNV